MSELSSFERILKNTYSTPFEKRKNKNWVSEKNTLKILELNKIPKKLRNIYRINKENFYPTNDIINYMKQSCNPHHITDFFIKMKWGYEKNPLVDIIKIFDKYGLRGMYNFDLNNCSHFNFKVAYFYNFPIPLIIDVVNEQPDQLKEKLYEIKLFKTIVIYVDEWEQMKDNILKEIESHIMKFNAFSFISKIIKDSNDLKDFVEEIGGDIVSSCCNNEKFPFPLSQCLNKFGILKGNSKYNDVMKLFVESSEFQYASVTNSSDELEDDIDNLLIDDELCDSEDCTSELTSNYDFNDVIQNNTNTLYVEGIDYMYDYDSNEYYLSYPSLVKVAIRVGVRKAEAFIDKSWKLIEYINNFGKTSYNSLINGMSLSLEERKNMFVFSENVVEQQRIYELNKANEKIKKLEEYMNISNREKEIKSYILNPPTEVYNHTIKTGSIIKNTSGPINNNELDLFLGNF